MPQRARRSSSSSGIASSVRISRWYRRLSWSSQTCVLLAMSTSLGIHAESLENALGLRVEAREVRRLAAPAERAGAAVAPAAEPQVEAALLLGDDVERQQHPVEELVERIAQEVAPVVADVPQLARERRRVGPRGCPEQLHERLAVAPDAGQRRLVRLDLRDRRIATRRAERRVVEQGAQRAGRRVLVRDPDEEHLLEPLGARAAARRRGTPWPRRPGARRRAPGRARPRRRPRSPSSRSAARAPRPWRRRGGRSRGAARARRARRPGRWARRASASG